MLYSSVDDVLLREIIPVYEAESGVRVDLVGDTEATKSTGLAERVIAERAAPRGDVWWSSEPFFSIRLTREGLLVAEGARDALTVPWPGGLMAADGSWAGLACRARVLVYRRSRVPEGEVPRTLDELAEDRWRGRVAMARPEFGTTRGHMAALVEADGLEAVESWLRAMKASGLKVYSGNSTVVRAVAQGEADVGLTDTDDVWSGQRNGWDVEAAYEAVMGGGALAAGTAGRLGSRGPLVLPNTAGLIAGGPNVGEGRRLLAWILGGEAERRLARSESRNMPVHPAVSAEFPELVLPGGWRPDLERVTDHLDEAATMAARVLDG